MKKIFLAIKHSLFVIFVRHHGVISFRMLKIYFKKFIRCLSNKKEYYNPFDIKDYNLWLQKNNDSYEKLKSEPKISIVIPVYNIEKQFLDDCLNSILNQKYQNFEVCLADDCSTKKETIELLKYYEKKDKRIKVVYRKENGHISKATNSAIEISTGDYIALMDDDDLLTENALYEVAKCINNYPQVDFIYSDEDKMTMDGMFCEPHFKSDFLEDSFYGGNFICHFTVIRKEYLNKIGLFDSDYVGAQDFDLFLRATEQTENIVHISKILYHWRKVPGSTADTVDNKEYAIENGKKAVEASLKRRNKNAFVTIPIKCTHYVVHYKYDQEPKVSIIMINNNVNFINENIKTLEKTNYKNLEMIIVNDSYKLSDMESNIVVVNKKIKLKNAIDKASGEIILIISGKIKNGKNNWLQEMVGYAMQKDIGIVAPKLMDNQGFIKSAGLILSSERICVDAFKNYFADSTGIYGRLLVPFNYNALSYKCVAFEKNKYLKLEKETNYTKDNAANIDLNLQMIKHGYRNVLLSHISVVQFDLNKMDDFIHEQDAKKLRNNWNLDECDYYNENLSKSFPFMLDIKGEESDEKTKN